MPKYLRAWMRVPHGKRTRGEFVPVGEIPAGGLPVGIVHEVKRQVKTRWLKTGKIVRSAEVEEIAAAIMLAKALTT